VTTKQLAKYVVSNAAYTPATVASNEPSCRISISSPQPPT